MRYVKVEIVGILGKDGKISKTKVSSDTPVGLGVIEGVVRAAARQLTKDKKKHEKETANRIEELRLLRNSSKKEANIDASGGPAGSVNSDSAEGNADDISEVRDEKEDKASSKEGS